MLVLLHHMERILKDEMMRILVRHSTMHYKQQLDEEASLIDYFSVFRLQLSNSLFNARDNRKIEVFSYSPTTFTPKFSHLSKFSSTTKQIPLLNLRLNTEHKANFKCADETGSQTHITMECPDKNSGPDVGTGRYYGV